MSEQTVVLGRVSGLFGVKGWVKVYSYTRPKENIFNYRTWLIGGKPVELEHAQVHGKGLVVKLRGYDDRDAVAVLQEAEISVLRDALPTLAAGDYYWSDLVGLRVVNLHGVELGCIEKLFETPANDVLVVKDGEQERLLPLVMEHVVVAVDLAQGVMRVDWEADY